MAAFGRRRTLQTGLWLAAGAALGGCAATAPKAQGRPQNQQTVIPLLFMANEKGPAWTNQTVQLFQEFVDATFNADNPGLRASVYRPGIGSSQITTQISASLAGKDFVDVWEGWSSMLPPLVAGNWLVPLDSYLSQDNVSVANLWPTRQTQTFQIGGRQLALPSYTGPKIFIYRRDVLAQLGQPVPSPDWTYTEAAALWTALAGVIASGKGRRYGAALTLTNSDGEYLFGAWGVPFLNAARNAFAGDTAGGVQALSWINGLYANRVVQAGWGSAGAIQTSNNMAVFSDSGPWDLFGALQGLGGVDWDYFPPPLYPNGRAAWLNDDFYGINAASKHPEQAWLLLRYLTVEPAWQQFQIKSTLITPSLNSLWDNWLTEVQQLAPVAQTKALHYFRDAAQGSWGYPDLEFAVSAARADTLIAQTYQSMLAGQLSPTGALRQLRQQLDALVAA